MPIKPKPAAQTQAQPAAKKPAAKREVKTKEQLIADAVIPADGTVMKLKRGDEQIELAWPEAAQQFLAAGAAGGKRPSKGDLDFADTADRYKAWKWERQQAEEEVAAADASGALNEGEPPTSPVSPEDLRKQDRASLETDSTWTYSREMEHEGQALVIFRIEGEEAGQEYSIPVETWDSMPLLKKQDRPVDPIDIARDQVSSNPLPAEAEPGDEVRIGADTYRVGHGGVLTSSPVADKETGATLKPYRRWQRELGAGVGGEWQATVIGAPYAEQAADPIQNVDTSVVTQLEQKAAEAPAVQTGDEQSFTASDVQQVGLDSWRVGSGLLEKIGLPEYSALQIGPITASRTIVVTGSDRYSITRENGSVITAPKEVVDAIIECANAVEIGARIIRADAVSFIAAAKPGSIDMAKGGGANMN